MFIRVKRKSLGNHSYIQHQLIRSVRTPKGPRQEVLYNFGNFLLDPKLWKNFCHALEDRLSNQNQFSFGAYSEEVSALADHYSQLILNQTVIRETENQNSSESESTLPIVSDKPPHFEPVDTDSLKTQDVRSMGSESILWEQLKRLKWDAVLTRLGFREREKIYATMAIVGRAAHPSSERECARWIRENSNLQELMATSVSVYDQALHRATGQLWEHREALEEALAQRSRDLFSLKEHVILYDLTNTYFEGRKTGNSLAQFGHSKEKRRDCRLMTLALVVDEEGFPKRSKILEGNVGEAETLKLFLDQVQRMACRCR